MKEAGAATMDFSFWISLCLLVFMPTWCRPVPPEINVTACEGETSSIPLNTAEESVDLADSPHTQNIPCLLSVGSKPFCKGLRDRARVLIGALLLHNVSKADEGRYEIRPHLNGNTPTIIVHLEVKGCLPSSIQGPHEYLPSGTTHLRDRSSGEPVPLEINVTACEGETSSIPLNTAEESVDLADSPHTQNIPCLLSVGSKPFCKGLRDRARVLIGALLLHNVSKADEGRYEIRPHLNGNIPTIIVHLEVKGCLPSSTEAPHKYLPSGTTHPRDRSSGEPGAMNNLHPLVWVMVCVGVTMLIVLLSLLYQHLRRRRRQSSAHLASNTNAPQASSCQLNGCQVDQALQEERPLSQGLLEDQEHEL